MTNKHIEEEKQWNKWGHKTTNISEGNLTSVLPV